MLIEMKYVFDNDSIIVDCDKLVPSMVSLWLSSVGVN